MTSPPDYYRQPLPRCPISTCICQGCEESVIGVLFVYGLPHFTREGATPPASLYPG